MGLIEMLTGIGNPTGDPSPHRATLLALIQEGALCQMPASSVAGMFGMDEATTQTLTAMIAGVRYGTPKLLGDSPLERMSEIKEVMHLGLARVPPYDTVAGIAQRLGL